MTNKAEAKKGLEHYDVYNSPFLELLTPFNKWEAIKMACLIWLVPIRLFVGISALLVLACVSYVAAFGQNINEPLTPWRRRMVVGGSKCARVITVALGMRVRVEGYHHVAEANRIGAMGIFNHTAWVDAILLMWLFAPSGVSHERNARIPIVGTCISAFQNISVPSSAHGSAQKAKERPGGTPSISDLIADRAKDRRFPILMMAPEGTCGDGRCILQFRSGSFLPGVPLLPILLQYDKSCHNPAWTIVNEGWHFLRLVCQPYNSVVVRILPPYVPSEREAAQPRVFAENVRRLFSQELRLPMVEQTVFHYAALTNSGIRVSLDGRRIESPPGLVKANGMADISSYI